MINKIRNSCVVVDLGGSKISAAKILFGDEPIVVSKVKVSTPKEINEVNIVDAIVEVVNEVTGGHVDKCDFLGICSTGIINPVEGVIVFTVNLKLSRFNIVNALRKKIDLPCYIQNDTKAAAIGEFYYGIGKNRNWDLLVYVTVATGIGGAIVYKGEIIEGNTFSSGEFGHISIEENGEQCRCGNLGCVDAYASGHGIIKYVQRQINSGVHSILLESKTITMPIIFEASKKGDKVSLNSLKRAGHAIGRLSAIIYNSLNPDAIVFGGGIVSSDSLIWDILKKSYCTYSLSKTNKENLFYKSKLEPDSGLFGISNLGYKSLKK